MKNAALRAKTPTGQKIAPEDFTVIILKGSRRIYEDVSQGKI